MKLSISAVTASVSKQLLQRQRSALAVARMADTHAAAVAAKFKHTFFTPPLEAGAALPDIETLLRRVPGHR